MAEIVAALFIMSATKTGRQEHKKATPKGGLVIRT
jgi:hypothetical protein